MKGVKYGVVTAVLVAGLLVLVGMVSGCQSADPASRSNRTSYRDLIAHMHVHGHSNYVEFAVGDGLYASADGGGDSLENTATQTTDTKPEVAVGVGGSSAGTGGAAPSSGLAGAALEKLMGMLGGKAPAGTELTEEERAAIVSCMDSFTGGTTEFKE